MRKSARWSRSAIVRARCSFFSTGSTHRLLRTVNIMVHEPRTVGLGWYLSCLRTPMQVCKMHLSLSISCERLDGRDCRCMVSAMLQGDRAQWLEASLRVLFPREMVANAERVRACHGGSLQPAGQCRLQVMVTGVTVHFRARGNKRGRY